MMQFGFSGRATQLPQVFLRTLSAGQVWIQADEIGERWTRFIAKYLKAAHLNGEELSVGVSGQPPRYLDPLPEELSNLLHLLSHEVHGHPHAGSLQPQTRLAAVGQTHVVQASDRRSDRLPPDGEYGRQVHCITSDIHHTEHTRL